VEATEVPRQEILDDCTGALAASGANKDGCKLVYTAAHQKPNYVLGYELLHVSVKAIEWAKSYEQYHIRGELIPADRYHEDRSDVAVEHPARRELGNRTVQSPIDRFGGTAGSDIPKYAEHIGARIHVRDASVCEREFDSPVGSLSDCQIMEVLR
jgi:hypothetical protein